MADKINDRVAYIVHSLFFCVLFVCFFCLHYYLERDFVFGKKRLPVKSTYFKLANHLFSSQQNGAQRTPRHKYILTPKVRDENYTDERNTYSINCCKEFLMDATSFNERSACPAIAINRVQLIKFLPALA